VEEAPDLVDDGAAFEKDVFDVGVSHQVQVTLAVADFGVFDAVHLPGGGRRLWRGW